MKVSHTWSAVSSAFDDPNLVSTVGLVPVMGLAAITGLDALVDEHLTDPGGSAMAKNEAMMAGPGKPHSAGPMARDVRLWAASVELECPDRGEIPAAVLQAYIDAHQ